MTHAMAGTPASACITPNPRCPAVADARHDPAHGNRHGFVPVAGADGVLAPMPSRWSDTRVGPAPASGASPPTGASPGSVTCSLRRWRLSSRASHPHTGGDARPRPRVRLRRQGLDSIRAPRVSGTSSIVRALIVTRHTRGRGSWPCSRRPPCFVGGRLRGALQEVPHYAEEAFGVLLHHHMRRLLHVSQLGLRHDLYHTLGHVQRQDVRLQPPHDERRARNRGDRWPKVFLGWTPVRLCRKFCSGGHEGTVAPVRIGIRRLGNRTVRLY
jgi:hypothetical protein